MKKSVLMVIAILGIGLLSACSTNAMDQTAVGFKGGKITEEEVFDSLKRMNGADTTVQKLIVYKVFENKYGNQISNKEINAEYEKTKKQLGEHFDSSLKALGYTEESYKKELKLGLAYNKGLESHVKVTDKELKTAWESFHPEVEVQIIKASSEDEAKALKKSADAGEDFTKLVKEKSTDTSTKDDGGKIKFDSQTMNVSNEVKEAAFKLKDGEISDVITTTNTSTYATDYYVVKMVKNQEKGNDMDKYKQELKKIAAQNQLTDNTFVTKVIGEELKEANVKVKDTTFKNALDGFSTAATSETQSTDSAK